MPGATRKGLPKCEELIERFNKRRSIVDMLVCGKPAVAQWFWRVTSDIPKYVCLIHDKKINKEEMEDEPEVIMEEDPDEEPEV